MRVCIRLLAPLVAALLVTLGGGAAVAQDGDLPYDAPGDVSDEGEPPAAGGDGGEQAPSAPGDVEPPAVDGDAQGEAAGGEALADTGADATGLVLIAGLAILGGAAALLARRRRA